MSSPDATATTGGTSVVAVNIVFTFLAIIAVTARLYARNLTRQKPSIDDWLIIAGLMFTIATMIVGILMVTDGGVGLQQSNATISQGQALLKLFVPAPLLWSCATTCVKLSILFFYIGIFEWPGFRKATYVIVGLSFALWVVVVLESFLLCRPFAYTWNKNIPGGVCGNSSQAYLSIAIFNLIIDLSIVALPMPVLWQLQMSLRKKLVVSSVLGLGLIVCVMTALRIETVVALDPLNFTYTVVFDLIYGGLEVQLGIVSACLPILQPVFKKHYGFDGVFPCLTNRTTTKQDSENSKKPHQKWASGSSREIKNPSADALDTLYPVTTTSFAEFDMDNRAESYDSPNRITVTQQLHVSSEGSSNRFGEGKDV